MNTDILTQQQLWSAWVSAGAAVLQAVGAIVAIAISIKLARDSRKREIAAEAASLAREEAMKNSTERQISFERYNQKVRQFDTIYALAARAVTQISQILESNREVAKLPNFSPGPTQRMPSCETFILMVPSWCLQIDDPELIAILHQSERVLSSFHISINSQNIGQRWIGGLEIKLKAATQWLDRLSSRRPVELAS